LDRSDTRSADTVERLTERAAGPPSLRVRRRFGLPFA
jgi:hypothetical protein